jgi:hypothetical protein
MRHLAPLLTLAAATLLIVSLGAARQDEEGDGMRNLVDLDLAERQALQVRAMQLAQPTDEHQRLTAYAGTFDAEVQMWTAPGQAPTKAKGEMLHESVLGGRFLRITGRVNYDFPGIGKYEVDSIQYLGFDRRNGNYTSIGFDSMGTYSTTAMGSFDAENDHLTMSGVTEDESLKIRQAYDTIVELVDADTMKVTTIVYDAFQPGPFKLMEVVSRRRKE